MLKVLMLRKKIDDQKKLLAAAEERSAAFAQREADLEASIAEAATEEEQRAVEEAVTEFEAERDGVEAEKASIREAIAALEADLAELERETKKVETIEKREEKREVEIMPNIRFREMTMEQRTAFVQREAVKEFIERTRELIAQKRAIGGKELLIPVEVYDLMKPEVERMSKLMRFVNVKEAHGDGRQPVLANIPEAVWTEACATINELDLDFAMVETGNYKVAGFVPICNALLEDTDVNLLQEVMDIISAAIAKAIDKAILFGTGIRMPLGIATRLAQTSQPETWPATAPAWTDLHTSNVLTLNIDASTGAAFFESLLGGAAAAKPKLSSDGLFWVMNHKTHLDIMAKAIGFNSAGSIVAGISNTMPIIGGEIVELDDIGLADNEIIGGYGKNYLLSERKQIALSSSDQGIFFIQDHTVVKGVARADGQPVAGEAFVIINYNNTTPTTAQSFAPDYANADPTILAVTAAAGTASGDTVLTVTGYEAQSSPTLKYKVGVNGLGIHRGDKVTGFTALTSGTTQITAAAGKLIAVVELDANSRVVSVGSVASIPKA